MIIFFVTTAEYFNFGPNSQCVRLLLLFLRYQTFKFDQKYAKEQRDIIRTNIEKQNVVS